MNILKFRYRLLSERTWPTFEGGSSADGVALILRENDVSASDYAFGRTKIFLRCMKTLDILDELRRREVDRQAVLIQKTFR